MRTREHGRYARTVNLAQQIAAMERDLVRQRAMAERMGRQSLLEGFLEELTELKERWATLQAAPAPQEPRHAKETVKTGQ